MKAITESRVFMANKLMDTICLYAQTLDCVVVLYFSKYTYVLFVPYVPYVH